MAAKRTSLFDALLTKNAKAQELRRLMSTNEHGGTRTPDPQDRNLMLYPLSYIPSFFREYSTVGKDEG